MSTELAQRFDINALIARAVDGSVPVETLERLLIMAKDIRAEQARAAWHVAMAKFQSNVPEILKTKVAEVVTKSGARYKYAYAPLDEAISAVRPALSLCGLSATFEILTSSDRVVARCLVAHEDGHVQTTEFSIPIDISSHMNPAQQVASASTYARRYAYMAALGLAPEDDDDGQASGAPREMTVKDLGKTPTPPPDAGMEPVREYENESGQPLWRGTLISYRFREGVSKANKPYTMHFFMGQDGKEFTTFDHKFSAALQLTIRKQVVEICWEPGNKPDARDIVAWKTA